VMSGISATSRGQPLRRRPGSRGSRRAMANRGEAQHPGGVPQRGRDRPECLPRRLAPAPRIHRHLPVPRVDATVAPAVSRDRRSQRSCVAWGGGGNSDVTEDRVDGEGAAEEEDLHFGASAVPTTGLGRTGNDVGGAEGKLSLRRSHPRVRERPAHRRSRPRVQGRTLALAASWRQSTRVAPGYRGAPSPSPQAGDRVPESSSGYRGAPSPPRKLETEYPSRPPGTRTPSPMERLPVGG